MCSPNSYISLHCKQIYCNENTGNLILITGILFSLQRFFFITGGFLLAPCSTLYGIAVYHLNLPAPIGLLDSLILSTLFLRLQNRLCCQKRTQFSNHALETGNIFLQSHDHFLCYIFALFQVCQPLLKGH